MRQLNVKQKIFCSIILGIFCTMVSFAQGAYEISGAVTADDGIALPGVNVIVVGTPNGTATDFDGNYKITASTGDVLEFNYIGFATQTIKLTGQKTINVTLAEDATALADVVVVGYGTRKKSDLTGAVVSVKSEELTAFPVLDAAQALQGRAAGVQVQSNNGGEPGAPIGIQIRGNTSISGSSNPLIVVDGFANATMPQASDIQSIEVLKDASSTAIYGTRGANGVILVTTKKGKKGKLSVEYNTNYSIQRTANELDLLNADQFAEYQQLINPTYAQGSAETDWQDVIYGFGSANTHNLSFSGGSEKTSFYASANYFKQDGVVLNSGFERFTFLTNIDSQVSDKVKFGMNLFVSRGVKDGVSSQSTGDSANGGGDDVISLANRFAPDQPITDSNGDFSINSVGDNVDNPFAVATQRDNETTSDLYRANFFGNYTFLKNFSLRSSVGFSAEDETERNFIPSTLIVTDGGNGGEATIDNEKDSSLLTEHYLTYSPTIGKGKLTVLAGYSYQYERGDNFSAGSQNFIDESVTFFNLASGEDILIPESSITERELQSVFGRFNFDYDDKYLITASVRRDGSSVFPTDNKYATFPSAAIAWKASNEAFLVDSNVVSNLKLRASYGQVGNQGVSPFSSFGTLETENVLTDGGVSTSVIPGRASNPNLEWETTTQLNFGLDLGFLNNKISLTVEYYDSETTDLLLADATTPLFIGLEEPDSIVNIGSLTNKGVEITLNTRNISNENFSWSTDFNLTHNKNEITTLLDGDDILLDAAPSYFSNGASTHILREGEAAGVFFGLDYQGVYQGGDLPAGTAISEIDDDGNLIAGSPLFADVNGDGVIDTDDRTIIGDPNPDFTFGFTNNFRYKDFDLSIFFQGVSGGDIFNLTNVQLFNGDSNALTDVLNAWTVNNTDTNIPRVAARGREISSRFVEDGSYVRLKNITLGYNLPKDVIAGIGLEKARFSVSAQNLFTITDYSGLDPEVSFQGDGGDNINNNTTRGFDFGNYPTVRSVTFSANFTF